jgi:ankyrin repeat protein
MVMPEDASLKNLAPPQPTTRLGIAAKNGDTEMVNTEIRISVVNEDNEAEKYTNSPIIWAADGGHTECVRAILEAGRNVNRQGYLGATAASRAARKGHAALLDLLLSNGADPEIPNVKLQFPLHFAAFNGHEDCVQVLLRHKASPWVLDRKGRTPAQDTANENIIHILYSSAGM